MERKRKLFYSYLTKEISDRMFYTPFPHLQERSGPRRSNGEETESGPVLHNMHLVVTCTIYVLFSITVRKRREEYT